MKNYKTFFENTIINNIDFQGYDNIKQNTLFDKINSVYGIFISEYGFLLQRKSEIKVFTEWLQGLPSVLTVPFYNYEILENAKNNNFNLNTEKKENDFLNTYWVNLSIAFFELKNNL